LGFRPIQVFLLMTLMTFGATAEVKHVVVIGVDGMSPNGVLKAEAPNMKHLREQGAWTFHARGVMPTSSSPNWASMIMGAGPEQHGVTSNEWETNKFEIEPTVKGPGGIFPTIFSVIRGQRPDSYLAVYHDWDGFGRLVERNMVNVVEHDQGPTNTMHQAVACLTAHQPTLLFVHLDHVDHAGHEFGHGTPEYYAAVKVADKLIGEMLTAIEQAGLRESTVVLITADHGGVGKGHGGATMPEIEIPWIISGPDIQRGYEIKSPVNTFDTAATIALLLRVKTPDAWIARPVTEALEPGSRSGSQVHMRTGASAAE
jgi:predicted AlkP superfamily pyrophosphatase or phosphodiesterase